MTKTENKAASNTSSADDSNTVIFVGGDDGHDSIKLAARECSVQPDGSLAVVKTIEFVMPSKAVRGSKVLNLTGQDQGGGIYTTPTDNGGTEHWTVTDTMSLSDVVDTRSINYPTSPLNRVLVHDALIRSGLGGKDVRIVTGLPVGDYFERGGSNLNHAQIEAKKKNLLEGQITAVSKSQKIANVVAHNVACEGIAAVYDMAIKDDGTDDADFFALLEQGSVGVIDIGGKTIDLAVVFLERGSHQIDRSRSSSIDYGMLKLMRTIEEEIAKAYNVDDLPPRVMLRVLQERKIMISGEWQDVSEQVEKAVARAMLEISDRLRAAWPKSYDLARIIVVGGGAYLLADALRTHMYKQAEARPKPEYANARGMLKLAMRTYVGQQRRAAETVE